MKKIKEYIEILTHSTRGMKYFLILNILVFTSCEKWYDTKEVSHISTFPKIEITGGDFLSFVVNDSAVYEDPGAKAFDNGTSLAVYSSGEVDLSKIGVYFIQYYAENSDGIYSRGERVVTVTRTNESSRNLSGTYEATKWEPFAQMKVERVDSKGLYKCSEVFGFPGTKMRGRFVDLGKDQLVLLHGEGDFGKYASVGGTYTLTTLNWTIYLLEGAYAGAGFAVEWKKIEE